MTASKVALLSCVSLLLAAASPAFAMAEAIPSEFSGRLAVPAVSVRAVPVTDVSRPLLAAPEGLSALGYVEEEYFISGMARTYDWVDDTLEVRPVSEPAAYTVRVLVRRPVDPAKFSGNIAFETLNASGGIDVTTTMGTSADSIMRRGDVWVGVTSKALTQNALKRFDPVRYADLVWPNPTPPERQCPHPSIIPEYSFGNGIKASDLPPISSPASEDGLIWDIYAQIGAFLKSDARSQVLPGFRPPHVFATGYSQSGLIQRTFISGFHSRLRTPDGAPIFDGYLVEVGPAMLRINQCSQDVLPDDPRNRLPEIDAPVINIVSEGDMWLGLHTRQPDIIGDRTGIVTYEIAGAAHKHGFGDKGRPSSEEARRAGVPAMQIPLPAGIVLNDMPRGYISSAALANLQAWALQGVAPPQAPRLQFQGDQLARDQDGNALGGLRNPWIDVPVATYRGALGVGALSIVGSKTPFSKERLQALYPDHATYVARFETQVAEAVAGRWLLAEDADHILASARDAEIP